MMHIVSTASTDQPTAASYASPTRRSSYVQAMQSIAVARERDALVRVYMSISPTMRKHPHWPKHRAALEAALPGVDLLDFAAAFPGGPDQYDEEWPQFAAGLDGLVVYGARRRSRGRTYTLGHMARMELRTLVASGKPVLLAASTRGLVPVVDCDQEKFRRGDQKRLRLVVPEGWTPDAPTLQAALAALRPKTADCRTPVS